MNLGCPSCPQGNTLAHFAAKADGTAVMRLLLERGVRIDLACYDGFQPIHAAASKGRLGNVKVLVEEGGIHPDVRAKAGFTPLMSAAGDILPGRSNPEAVAVMKYLLGTGRVDVNAKLNSGSSSLHCAASCGALDVLEVLVAAGADTSAKRRDGKTAAQLAQARGHTVAARYLIEQSVQRARVAAAAAAGPSSSRATATTPRPALSPSVVLSGRRCHTCNKRQDEPRVSLGACAGCLCTFYCSTECQQVDWGRGHGQECLPRLRRFLEAARASGIAVAEDHPVARRAASTV